MDILTTNVQWLPVIVGAVLAYMLGALWYSERMFMRKWKAGIGTPAIAHMPMAPGMIAQAFGTFFFAWIIGIADARDSLGLALLVGFTIAVFIKANGFFAGKTRYAIAIEAGFVLAMLVVFLLVHSVL